MLPENNLRDRVSQQIFCWNYVLKFSISQRELKFQSTAFPATWAFLSWQMLYGTGIFCIANLCSSTKSL